MAKIAVQPGPRIASKPGEQLATVRRLLARGAGWTLADVVCCAGPGSIPFEEQHQDVSVAMVLWGTFQYRSGLGRELMTPGCLLLGNPGQYFQCSHEHAVGDHCLSFTYTNACFETILRESGLATGSSVFRHGRVPPIRQLSSLFSRVMAELKSPRNSSKLFAGQGWDEIALEIAGRALAWDTSSRTSYSRSLSAEARVTRVIRRIEAHSNWNHDLAVLADEARLSRYHFLRVFQELTGLTPHRYVLRTRLRHAATRVCVDDAAVLDIAMDCGFGDVSNFNHAFRAEFGASPRVFRKLHAI